jgi:hypothetical protein
MDGTREQDSSSTWTKYHSRTFGKLSSDLARTPGMSLNMFEVFLSCFDFVVAAGTAVKADENLSSYEESVLTESLGPLLQNPV